MTLVVMNMEAGEITVGEETLGSRVCWRQRRVKSVLNRCLMEEENLEDTCSGH